MNYTIRANSIFVIHQNGNVYVAGDTVTLTPEEYEQHKHKLEGVDTTVPSSNYLVGGGIGSGTTGGATGGTTGGTTSTLTIFSQAVAIADWVLSSGKYMINIATGLTSIAALEAFDSNGQMISVDYTDLGSGSIDVYVNELPDARFDGSFKIVGE